MRVLCAGYKGGEKVLIIVCFVLLLILCTSFWIVVKDIEDDIEDLEQLGTHDRKGGQE